MKKIEEGGRLPLTLLPTEGGAEGFHASIIRFGNFVVGSVIYECIFDGVDTFVLHVNKSVDGGVTFTEVGLSANSPAPSKPIGMDLVLFQGKIYCLSGDTNASNTPSQLQFGIFDPSTDTWSAPVDSGLRDPVQNSGIGRFYRTCISLQARSNSILAAYPGAIENVPKGIGTTDVSRVWWAEYSSGSWSSGAQIPNQTGVTSAFGASGILVDSTDRAYFLLQQLHVDITMTELNQTSLDSGNSWHTFQTVTSDLSVPQISVVAWDYPVGIGVVYVTLDTTERLAIPFIGGNTTTDGGPPTGYGGPARLNYIAMAPVADDPTWTIELFDNTTQVSGDPTSHEVFMGMVYQDPNLYVYWVSPTAYAFNTDLGAWQPSAGDVLRSFQAFGSSTWSSPEVVITDAAPFIPSGVWPVLYNGFIDVYYFRLDYTSIDDPGPGVKLAGERHLFLYHVVQKKKIGPQWTSRFQAFGN